MARERSEVPYLVHRKILDIVRESIAGGVDFTLKRSDARAEPLHLVFLLGQLFDIALIQFRCFV